MIAKSYIRKNLEECSKQYNSARSKKTALFYSKIALLELCGWIELSFDELVLATARRRIKVHSNLEHVEKKIVEPNYGFEYEKHFKSMLVRVVGLAEFELVEKNIAPALLANFKSSLGNLKVERNRHAHTYLKGVTHTIFAPSTTMLHYSHVSKGVDEFDRALKRKTK